MQTSSIQIEKEFDEHFYSYEDKQFLRNSFNINDVSIYFNLSSNIFRL